MDKPSHSILVCTFIFVGAFLLLQIPTTPTATAPSRSFSCGESVPIDEVFRAIYHRQFIPNPESEPIVPLTESDARRRESAHIRLPPQSHSLQWSHTYFHSMVLPRQFLKSPLVDRLLVVTDNADRPRAVYCPVFGTMHEALRAHLGTRYTLRPLWQFSIRDRERLLTTSEIFRFLFVENPVRRLQHIFQNATDQGLNSESYRNFLSQVRGVPLAKDERIMQLLTPKFFLAFLSRLPVLTHTFASQSDSCGYSVIQYHLAGHVESFSEHIMYVNRNLSLPGGTFHTATGTHHRALPPEWMEKRLLSRIAKLYADDFRHFGYSTEDLA
ncbi:hypothetical protein BWQ96_01312 [Gracilariopsis chorda]|uniref:Uncharacterized protein n=1 Tax=Gracilariopsis chorda TaxID=448386 RepID=A0A2V3J6G6_9FLOR|nr:hypothetical protein BWQ96_01312 [Gracilariopsis chorda]|eukprot:PXF48970.1 hypothetical protein BWQ96_01312 [Gracilariopsis chorda]